MNWSVEETYCSFVLGHIPADGVYSFLKPDQVDSFVDLHEQVKAALESGKGELPPVVTVHLIHLFINNRRRFAFALAQVDALIEKDIEKNVFRSRGTKNIIRRES